jgi:ribosomal protein S18 acetylase RimI-like enzyme
MGYLRLRRQLSLPLELAPLPAGMTLAPFSPDVAREAHDLIDRVYGGDNAGDSSTSFDSFWSSLSTDPEYDPALIFIAVTAGRIVGLCHCWSSNFVKNLVVDPAFERRGIGAALLTAALLAFKSRGATHVDLKTDIDNEKAQSLYRRLGFVIVERVD